MSARAFAIVMVALAVVALLGFGLLSEGDGGVAVGEPLDAGALPPLEEPTGSTKAVGEADPSEDYRGQWVLVNVWASWCDPCREESPALERFWREHKRDDFVLVGVDTQDNTEDARAFIDEFGLTYPHLHDGSGEWAEDAGTTGVPESFLLDPHGNVAFHWPGPVTEEILAREIASRIEPTT